MHGIDPKQKKLSYGLDTDALRRKVAHPMSEDRKACKQVKNELKYGLSKGSPFLSNKNTDLVHPSTKVIFEDPDKKLRPFTSKVNSALRKSLLQNRRGKILNETKEKPAPKNALSAFAGTSMSPEKQKIVSYYGSSGSIKEIKNKVKKCEYPYNNF